MSKRVKRLARYSNLYIIFPAVVLALVLVASVILYVLYASTNENGYIIALISVFLAIVASFLAISYIFLQKANKRYIGDIYRTTYNNIKKLSVNDVDFDSYKETDIKEINELNEAMKTIKKRFDGGYLVMRSPDYEPLHLKYIDESRHLIAFESFKENLANIIYLSQSYRNVLIEVYFTINRGVLGDNEKKRLLDLYFRIFSDYEKSLFMYGEDDKSLLIYLPVVDSFARIKEQLELAVPDSSVVVRDVNGLENIPAQFALVAYPYSGEDYILSDLRYARRQNLPYNLFLPNRANNNIGQKILMNSSMNINYMSKVLNKISEIEYYKDEETNKKNIEQLFDELSKYLDIDEAGIIHFQETTNNYEIYVTSENSVLFKNARRIESTFIDILEKSIDEDDSFYFSNRKSANALLGHRLDFYGITSGYYHLVRNKDGKTIAVIYFFNLHSDFYIDSYLRESLYVISLRIAHFFEKKELLDRLDYQHTESEYILSMSDYSLMKIDSKYSLNYLSNDLKKMFPKVQYGQLCYKAIHNRETPCHDCPLKTFKKKTVTLGNDKYEISLALNERKTTDRTLLLTRLEEEQDIKNRDLFNTDYLVYSYASLYNALKNEYISNGRGYVLLLSIDNSEDFISNQGSEGFLFAVRSFARNIKNKLKTNDIYIYNPTTIAVHFPFVGHADIISKCEIIYELSKLHAFDDGSKDQLNITYLPLGYPRGYAYADDFMKHMSDFYHSDKYERNKDFIYFSDYSISRSASKREFMVSVIESEFSGHNSTSVNLQPIVRINDRHILGAEILLRIADAHRNVFFNALEISRIAEQENKTPIITESIINFVGNMYKEYGKNVFKINDFTRIAINIDQTYLRDPTLIKNVVKLCEENNLPNNFLSFEIPEDMIPDNIDKVKKFANELSNYHIYFSVDRFTGAYIGSEKLKDLGFNEIKIDRSLITKIDKDPNQYNAVKEIIENAHKVGITVGAVGVENEAQFKILKELDNNMVVQGYLLYKPLTRSDLISAIISYDK